MTDIPLDRRRHRIAGYRPDVDGLRSVAVIAVVLYHFNTILLPGGYLGVDMFFVISGYVITASFAKQGDRSFRDFLVGFYSRRIKRLLPALIVCVTVTSLLGSLFIAHSAAEYLTSLKAGAASLFGASNIYFLGQAKNYFGPLTEFNLFIHTWSLGVEEQFYLVFPTLFWLSGFGLNRSAPFRRLLYIMAVLGAGSLLAYALFIDTYPDAVYYLMPTRFWELCAGCLVYVVQKRGGTRLPSYSSWAAVAGVACGFLAAQDYQLIATIAVVSSTSVLIACMAPGIVVYRTLAAKAVVEIGRMSYSIYLWHWSVISLSRWTVGLHWWLMPIQLCVIFGLAALSYYYVESPLRYKAWSRHRLGVIGRGLASAVLASGFLIFLYKPAGASLYLGTRAKLIADDPGSLLQAKAIGSGRVWQPKTCFLGSNAFIKVSDTFDICTIPAKGAARRHILVIGNSFSVAEFEMYTVLTENNLGSVTLVGAAGSTPVAGLLTKEDRAAVNALYWRDVIPLLLSKLKSGDVVVMINSISGLAPRNPTAESEHKLQVLDKELMRMSSALARKNISVVFQSGLPFILDSQCNPDSAQKQWFYLNGKSPCLYYSREHTLARYGRLNAVLAKVAQARPRFHMLDLLPVFCAEGMCEFNSKGGTVLYRDAYGHPSIEASILARPHLLAAINAAIANMPPEQEGKMKLGRF